MILDKEAALSWGTLAAAIGAVVVLLQSFGVNISDEQEKALLSLCTIAGPVVVALVIRGSVFSRHSVRVKVDESFADAKQGATEPPKVL